MVPDVELIIHFFWVLAGLTALYFGAEWLVKGAATIAIKVGISPLVVGLTVVAFGTSAPELLVCLEANGKGQSDIALGNIIGSNICNLALILGVAAMMKPVVVHLQVIRREMPILIAATLLFVGLMSDKRLDLWEGALLFLGIGIYVVASLIASKRQGNKVAELSEFSDEELEEMKEEGGGRIFVSLGQIAVGLIVLKFGSEWLVVHGEAIALTLGVSEAIIALFLFAFGTSLPELATSVAAIRQGQGDIVTGNAVGSCIFNILAVMGITALVHPVQEQNIEFLDKAVMVGLTLGITIFMFTKMRLNRLEGGVLVLGYLGYSVIRYLMDQGVV